MTTIKTLHLDRLVADHTQDMHGKTVAITGTTSGTGYVCARELARLGARVLLLNRASERADTALARLRQEVPGGAFEPIVCDLQRFDSVRAAARDIVERIGALDVLCHNAGVMALPDQATVDGYDVQMQTNAIAPFLLTSELFGLLRASPEGRVVVHTSMARLGPPHEARYFEAVGGDLGGDGTEAENAQFSGPRWSRYHQSKLADCTFAFGLIERLQARGVGNVKVLLAHPGLAQTSLQTTSASTGGMDLASGFMANAQSAEDGALGILRACADPAAATADFFGPARWVGFPERLPAEPLLRDADNVAICWTGCERAVGAFRFEA